ncbi:MAG TPA: two-component system response regulator [Cyanobacteria bacterium UBA11149]|nr:two-component system response regulator [Cyanobacteria bacterium UBA11367]HBE60980.1 two-component system response regulator [Cyanobacteria bacterium UBA11366]HBK65876.1 two-component system response regulator [Cyanobacteria bacterium UBA11166]HBR72452.1 two-component system response regulator [Cyanobacteria bacterium UBA11159]HBS69399.1 two-component system response regulator [Cyanobacteria bacterium UBA11153]HBW90293.1 two-component system response regulator [Cyanobacteria bacterium UBA11
MSTVLVVEDNPSQMELISTYLREGGYSVIQVLDAKEVLDKALSKKPDVILTDVVMPGMSGFELCRQLKNHPVTANIPIVICSSKNQEIDRLWGMRQGAKAYLVKPFSQEDLLRTVKFAMA